MYKPRIKLVYEKLIVDLLYRKLNLSNRFLVPNIKKIVINIGLGEAIKNEKCLDICKECFFIITGKRPIIVKAKKSIAFFKLRKGMQIGLKLTLRNNKMWEFIDRLITIALPRVRDFKGISLNFDGNGNFSLGLKEQIIFPEISYDKIDKTRGMGLTFVMTTRNASHNVELLKYLGFPLKR